MEVKHKEGRKKNQTCIHERKKEHYFTAAIYFMLKNMFRPSG